MPIKRASALISNMDPVAREACMAAGSDQLANQDGVTKITQLLSAHLAPDAADSAYQEVARFSQFKRAAQTMGGYLAAQSMTDQGKRERGRERKRKKERKREEE